MNKTIAIAIDGPAGAGKSTIARRLAEKLGYIYVDTGALYRTVAYCVLKNGINPDEKDKVTALLRGVRVDIVYRAGEQRVLLDGEDVSELIRTPEVSEAASKTSAIPEVREYLLSLQRRIADENNVVMDGRDIATVVLPNAKVKIFLTATAEIRARRRYDELIQKGSKVTYEDVLADLKERDYRDMTREIAPLKPSAESVTVDTSELSLEESVAALESVVAEKIIFKG